MNDRTNETDTRGRRLRATLADNYALALTALLLVAALGGAVTYATHLDGETRTETRQVASWQSSGEFTHQATVVNDTEAFAAGTVLRNRSVYYQRLTPRLNGSFVYTYAASDGGNLTVETTVTLVMRSVEETGEGNETVYWRVERPLNEVRTSSLEPGERAVAPFSVNATAAAAEAARIDGEMGGTPGQTEVAVVARVERSGTRNGRPVEASDASRLAIASGDGVYRVSESGAMTDSGGQTEEIEVPAEYGPLRTAGGPLLLLLGGVGALGLVSARRSGRLTVTDAERRWLAYRSTRREFDDWITTGRVPSEAEGPPVVAVDSLSGLVDVAIDTDERVIEDRRRGACLVLGEGQWYRYDRPAAPTGVRSENGDGSTESADERLIAPETSASGEPDTDGGPATDEN
ncbi:DUF5305 domain-containing protein [Halomicroarcula limicola]|uniref:DUF5305 domain-containing protein n=1 Tax=Haloarcula limicola TaxID=1429915 RepID=A0A8J8C6M3_9EURY|nr:DUF5305 domain-containing protein [Halomicroarcula limicola]MBV0924103.1 DUF5305 domain-containing protein [Halomicroarcula limicola]